MFGCRSEVRVRIRVGVRSDWVVICVLAVFYLLPNRGGASAKHFDQERSLEGCNGREDNNPARELDLNRLRAGIVRSNRTSYQL